IGNQSTPRPSYTPLGHIFKEYSIIPQVDTSELNKVIDGKLQTTAKYNHTKEPVQVSIGDIVTYTLRIYNEGEINGKASL
ncbi:hypothetical protein, partial [Romboutsia ilealis]|uniref:hypothetical protein n=1 Tax=Romboutsia ilealis TaxID=1115758 RepID=UPI00272BA4B2